MSKSDAVEIALTESHRQMEPRPGPRPVSGPCACPLAVICPSTGQESPSPQKAGAIKKKGGASTAGLSPQPPGSGSQGGDGVGWAKSDYPPKIALGPCTQCHLIDTHGNLHYSLAAACPETQPLGASFTVPVGLWAVGSLCRQESTYRERVTAFNPNSRIGG
jgi:hypothetical protein